MTMRNAFGNLATDTTVDEGMTLLRRILTLLKPLGVVTGNQSNRLSVDVNSIAGGSVGITGTIGTLTTVTNVTTVQNQANIGGITAFEMLRAMSRTGYNTGVRANIT